MMALLWKDFRLQRLVLYLGAAFLVGPYVVAVAAQWMEQDPNARWALWAHQLANASMFSGALSLLTLAMLGGNAFAAERADRSVEFLAYLPPSRTAILISKALVALAAITVIGVVSYSIIFMVIPRMAGGPQPPWRSADDGLAFFLASGIILFGVSWGASTLLESPAISVGLGFAAPVAVVGVFLSTSRLFDWPGNTEFGRWYAIVAWIIGTTALVTGSVLYLRRVEP